MGMSLNSRHSLILHTSILKNMITLGNRTRFDSVDMMSTAHTSRPLRNTGIKLEKMSTAAPRLFASDVYTIARPVSWCVSVIAVASGRP